MPGAITGRPALLWRSPAVRLAIAAIPAWFTTAVLVFSAPPPMKFIVGAVLVTTALSPMHGLLATAAAAPLGTLAGTMLGIQRFRLTEAIVVAFLTGWLLRASDDRDGPNVQALSGLLLAAVAAMSVVMQAVDLARYPGQLSDTFRTLFYGYYLLRDRIGFGDAARIIEGIALTAAVVSIFRQRPALSVRLPIALGISATVAAVASLLLWQGIAPQEILRRHALIGARVSAHVGDVNAAGSYYALSACAALGMAMSRGGRRRAWWLGAAAAAALGLWLAESRSADGSAALVIGAAIVWRATAGWTLRSKVAIVGLVAAVVLAAGALRLRQLSTDPEYHGAGFRQQFNATSARMIAARPWSGVGVGQYVAVSPLFLSPELAFSYGAENAHNYFLHVAAELGGVGLALFVLWVAGGLGRGVRALLDHPRDGRLLGLVAGVTAFLGTCLTGHPLLVDEVAFPFWMYFGLLVGLSASALWREGGAADRPHRRVLPRTSRPALAAAGIAVVVATQAAARPELRPLESREVVGFYGWETGADGARYRWTGEYGSLFVPADVTRIYVPVRMPPAGPELPPMGIEARTTAAPGERLTVGEGWAIVNLELPDAVPPTRFKRINLKADRTWQPALYIPGSADLRSVGVQVGEIRMFREH